MSVFYLTATQADSIVLNFSKYCIALEYIFSASLVNFFLKGAINRVLPLLCPILFANYFISRRKGVFLNDSMIHQFVHEFICQRQPPPLEAVIQFAVFFAVPQPCVHFSVLHEFQGLGRGPLSQQLY